MKKMKRTLAIVLALILGLGVLAGCGKKAPDKYEVLVNDQSGKPVAGVTVQFCSDTECIMGETDANGTAVFEKEAGKYTIHILKAPEGQEASEYRLLRDVEIYTGSYRLLESSGLSCQDDERDS